MDTPEKAWQELNEQRRREYNHPEGSACPVCNGSGHVMKIWSDSEYYHGLLTICPECGTVRLKEDDTRRAGNAPRYGDYIDMTDWQRELHRKACAFAQHPEGVFCIGGQTATGKSHLCSKIYYHLMANNCSGLNYQPWKSFARRSSKDWQLIETAKGCNVLWLDSFLDVVSSRGTPTATDLDKALEVIDTEVGEDMRLRGVVSNLDGAAVQKVPASRLPSKFGFMLCHPCATVAPLKLQDYRIHSDPPGISGSLVEGRVVYDAFVLQNKAKAIYYQATT